MAEPTRKRTSDDTTPATSGETGKSADSKPWQFKKGNPGPKGLKKPPPPEDEPEPDTEGEPASALLAAMRRVVSTAPGKDRSPLEKNCREWLKADTKQFMTRMASMEMALLEAVGKGGGEQAPELPQKRDEGTERAMNLIEELLQGWEERQE